MMHFRFSALFLIVFVLLLQAVPSAFAASLVGTVDRNRIGANETLLLSLTLDQQADTSSLDLDALKDDFDVLGVSPVNSSSYRLVNGKTTQAITTQWNITLAPKRQGTLSIPPFSVAGASSKPISIQVESLAPGAGTESPLSVTVTASQLDAYPKQQIIVTVELSAQNNVGNLDGTPLALSNAEIKDLGQNARNQIKNGVTRQVIELKYAVFAKEPGVLQIPALTFSAVQGARRGFFGNSGGKRILARSKALTINIKEPPVNTTIAAKSIWLPSQLVELSSELSPVQSEYQVGTPINRKIIIKAQGQSAEAIPPISKKVNTGSIDYKTYEDKPQLHTEITGQGLIGTRIESNAIVPSSAGEITLPEIRLNWWNVTQQKWQQAILPAQTLVVADTMPLKNTQQTDISGSNNVDPSQFESIGRAKNSWLWQTVSAVLLLVCIAQFILLMRKKDRSSLPTDNTQTQETESKAWKKLQANLREGDARNIRTSLLAWARASAPDSNANITLMSWANKFESEAIKNALAKLEAHLYSNENNKITDNDLNALSKSLTSARPNPVEPEILKRQSTYSVFRYSINACFSNSDSPLPTTPARA